MSDRPLFPVGINVLVVRDNKLLLGKRKNSYGAGTWALPGGHLEQDEKMTEAAARELMEETGLTAVSFDFVNLFDDKRDDSVHYLQIGFVANDVKGDPSVKEPDVCEEWQWFDTTDLPENIFPSQRPNIEGLTKKINFKD